MTASSTPMTLQPFAWVASASFRFPAMISSTESTIRKVVGALVELILLAALAFMPNGFIPYGLQNSLHSAAFVVYRMGVESQ